VADEQLNVNIGVNGQQRVERAMRGTVSSSRRANRAIERDNDRASRQQRRRTDREVRDHAQAERSKRDQVRRTSRTVQAEMRSRAREAERSRRRSRGGGGGGNGAFAMNAAPMAMQMGTGAIAAAISGAITAALTTVTSQLERVTQAIESEYGIQDFAQRTVTGQRFERGLEELGGEVFVGQNPEQMAQSLAAVREEITEVARATNQEPGQLLEALSALQVEFSAFEFGRRNLRALAEEAQRLGTDVSQLARLAGLVNAQFGEMDQSRMFDILAQVGRQGAITPEGFAQNFASQAPTFRGFIDPNRAQTAEQNFRTFAASANVLRQGTATDNRAAVLMQNMLASLSRPEVQQNIALATGGRYRGHETVAGRRQRRVVGGIQMSDFRGENGVLDLAGYVEALQGAGAFGSTESVIQAVGDQQASQALFTLIDARAKELQDPEGSADLRELTNVSAETGNQVRTGNLQRIRATESEQAKALAVESQIAGLQGTEGAEGLAAAGLRVKLSDRREGFGARVVGRALSESDTVTNIGGLISTDSSASRWAQSALTGAAMALGGPGAMTSEMAKPLRHPAGRAARADRS
jgi:NTP pyrophosphatase (non-canonical NTP hydrolase)